MSLTPNIEDFIGQIQPSPITSIDGLNGESEVSGKSTVEWTERDVYGSVRNIHTTAYLVKNAQIRLFSPQCYFKEQQGKAVPCLWTNTRPFLR